MSIRLKAFFTFTLLTFFSFRLSAGDLYHPAHHNWKAADDYVFMQEVSQKIPTEKPVTSIALADEKCYAVISGQIVQLKGEILKEEKNSPAKVNRLLYVGGSLWALSDNGLFRLNGAKWQQIDNQKFVDLCMHNGIVHAATRDDVFRLENNKLVNIEPQGGYNTSDMTMVMEDGSQVHGHPIRIGPVSRISSFDGTLFVLRPGKLVLFDGNVVNRDYIDWGSFPSPVTHDMQAFGSRLFISTDRGLAVLRGTALSSIKGRDGLPYEKTTCLTKGFANDLWIGTTKGAIRMLPDDWHYFGADHCLPGNHVNEIAAGNNVVYIATDKGIGIIGYEPFTLLKKAAYYERHINEWGHKRLGFIHTLYKRNGEWIREISDNDGGHTAPYLAAMSYKYAVTGDETARAAAVDAFKSMLWLERITPKKGFIARAIWSATGDKDKMGNEGSGGLPAKWYPTKDGKWY